MTKRIRWKRNPAETGLSAVGAAPRGYSLHDGEITYAMVMPLGGNWARPIEGWYWVSGWDSDVPVVNTCNAPCGTPEEAKAGAKEYVMRWLKNSAEGEK